MSIDIAIPGDINVIKKEAEKILKYKDLIIPCRNSAHVEYESKSDTNNNRGDWNHLKITRTIPEQHTRIEQIEELQKQPYWALHTYFGKCEFKSTKHNSWAK
jgi:hypothetical protein